MSDYTLKSDTLKTSENDTENGPFENSKPEPRRRASRAGTRSVATLTDAQLARKRANDREAQRSIRQRTKDRIEGLEQRIRELTEGQNDGRSLEDVERRNSELEEELRRLRESLPNAENMMIHSFPPPMPAEFMRISMPPHATSYQNPWAMPPNMSPGATTAHSTSFPTPNLNVFSPAGSNYSASNAGSPLSEMESASDYFGSVHIEMAESAAPVNPIPIVQRPSFSGRPGIVRSVSYPDKSSQPTYSPVLPANLMGISEGVANIGPSIVRGQQPITLRMPSRTRPSMPASMPSTPSISLGPSTTSMPSAFGDQQPLATHITTSAYSHPLQQPQMPAMSSSFGSQPSMNPWELPLQFVPPTGPIDSILIGVLDRQRSLARSGASGPHLIGPFQPSLAALVNPERSNEVHPVASVLSNLIQRTALRGLAEKAAALFVMYRLCQWQIAPCLENFRNIPDWFAPQSSQFFTPHPIWATQIAWARLKEVVINEQERYATDEFQHIYATSLNLNWPYRDVDILNFEGNEVTLTPAFEAHVRNQSNWTMDEAFQMQYPELRDTCKFTGQME